jgi:hypothetical protein
MLPQEHDDDEEEEEDSTPLTPAQIMQVRREGEREIERERDPDPKVNHAV